MVIIAGLKSGKIDPDKIKPIRIVEKEGLIFTLDHRRLYSYQQAGIDIQYIKLDHVPEKDRKKFRTRNDGVSIIVRKREQ